MGGHGNSIAGNQNNTKEEDSILSRKIRPIELVKHNTAGSAYRFNNNKILGGYMMGDYDSHKTLFAGPGPQPGEVGSGVSGSIGGGVSDGVGVTEGLHAQVLYRHTRQSVHEVE